MWMNVSDKDEESRIVAWFATEFKTKSRAEVAERGVYHAALLRPARR